MAARARNRTADTRRLLISSSTAEPGKWRRPEGSISTSSMNRQHSDRLNYRCIYEVCGNGGGSNLGLCLWGRCSRMKLCSSWTPPHHPIVSSTATGACQCRDCTILIGLFENFFKATARPRSFFSLRPRTTLAQERRIQSATLAIKRNTEKTRFSRNEP